MQMQIFTLNIALSYVEPKYLIKFFIKYKLDFNVKFLYDMFHYNLTIKEIDLLCINFPNIVITGVSIYDISFDLRDTEISMKNIRRVRLSGKSYFCSHCDRIELEDDDMEVFAECTRIKYVEINRAHIYSLKCLEG